MLSLSQTTGYAIRALNCLTHERACLIREVAVQSGIAKPYLAKIFNLLSNQGLVTSKRGYRGGILLARPAREITLLQIVEAVDGEGWSRRCLMGWRDCSDHCTCPMHDMWAEIKLRIHDKLERTSLAEVASMPGNLDLRLETNPAQLSGLFSALASQLAAPKSGSQTHAHLP